ncbi:uncharacterized protein B0H18DRAFT_956665 [Fomitopsis serialis]|uniref:uncharacterized protein n=1 Tax=Fomitopsis serialis TaxID=139415 RepID=UPI002007C070|nr:uncharacterized protein B0H18DRAFT_956665 [Neoantrodia serialis]KAH9921289.1 hypothetical protein B0H18DRAFT_956665 [Neoantrodia serialis]
MIMVRGPNRASFMFGSSMRNQKIERTWVDVGEGFVRHWRVFFTRLETRHALDASNPAHLWLVQKLFLDDINDDADNWVKHWNTHAVSGKHHNQTPSDMRHLARVTVGTYEDKYQNDDVNDLTEYYGVVGTPKRRRLGQTGAGHSADTDDEDEPMEDHSDGEAEDVPDGGDGDEGDEVDASGAWVAGEEYESAHEDEESSDEDQGDEDYESEDDELVTRIIADQESNIRHAAVKVARHANPFRNQDKEDAFWAALQEISDLNYLPRNLNIRNDEWDDDGYPTYEDLAIGKRKQSLRVELPHALWLPRAETWCRAVSILTRVLDELEEEAGESSESASEGTSSTGMDED